MTQPGLVWVTEFKRINKLYILPTSKIKLYARYCNKMLKEFRTDWRNHMQKSQEELEKSKAERIALNIKTEAELRKLRNDKSYKGTSQCPKCGSSQWYKEVMKEEGTEYPIMSCKSCGYWGSAL